MTERQDKRLSRKIAAVEQDNQQRTADLEQRLSRVEADGAQTREVASKNWEAIRDARKEMGDVRQDLERLMTQVVEMGAVLAPPMPAFYHRPETVSDIVDQTVNRGLDLLGVELPEDLFTRWQGGSKAGRERS